MDSAMRSTTMHSSPVASTATPGQALADNASTMRNVALQNVQSRGNDASAMLSPPSSSPFCDSLRPHGPGRPESDAYDETARLISPSPASLNRQFAALPSDQQPPRATHPPLSAIPAFLSDNTTYNTDRHVRPLSVNGSSGPSHPRLNPSSGFSSPFLLEGSTPSSFAPSHNGPISSSYARPSRTSIPIFHTTTDLAAHHGIPQSLPPPPRTTPRRSVHHLSIPDTSALPEPLNFGNLCSNYLSMLSESNKSTSDPAMSTAANTVEAIASQLSLEEQTRLVVEALQGNFDARFDGIRVIAHHILSSGTASSHAASPGDFSPYDPNEYLTSPHDSPLDDDFLTTPALGMDLDVSPSIYSSPLFDTMSGEFPDDMKSLFPEADNSFFGNFDNTKALSYNAPLTHPSFDDLLPMPSPDTPALDPPASVSPPTTMQASPSTTAKSARSAISRSRRSGPTGTRKNLTPASLVPVDAPIQARKYVAPSATSRKDVPATFARKRARSQAFGDEDELDDQDGGASQLTLTEEEAIKAKRLQNTLAARRSRKRKLEYQRELEDALELVTRERDEARSRNMVLEALLRDKGFDVPP